MKSLRLANLLSFATLLTTLTTLFVLAASAQDMRHISIIHSFTGGTSSGNGNPNGFPLTVDSAGNFYGVTFWGGNFHGCSHQGCGVAYRLSPSGSGWTYTVLYEFPGNLQGAEPSQLTLDAAGNLYGVLSSGAFSTNGGSVFELSPTSSGPWKFTNLYSFPSNPNGEFPNGDLPINGVVFDGAGNLYGATAYGGTVSGGLGVIYELSPNGSGGWNQTVIYSTGFNAIHPNGVIFDSAGNLFGTADGGFGQNGSVFELTPVSGGGWSFNVIYSFTGGSDGAIPDTNLALDSAGNLYGTTSAGGTLHNNGTVFELSPSSGGTYTFNLLYTFQGTENSGNSYTPVTLDAAGNLYGSANGGPTGHGYVFELSPSSSGWAFGLVHGFTGGVDGEAPGALILDSTGDLYGTAAYGANTGCSGNSGCGTVFKLPPPAGARN